MHRWLLLIHCNPLPLRVLWGWVTKTLPYDDDEVDR